MTSLIASRAHYAVLKAIKAGGLPRISKGTKCRDCGRQAEVYDHRDYSKPLDVEAVCTLCNARRGPASRKGPLMQSMVGNHHKMKITSLHLPAPMWGLLKATSKRLDISMAEVVRRILNQHLKEPK